MTTYSRSDLLRMMAGRDAILTEHDEDKAALESALTNLGLWAVVFATDAGPWKAVDLRAYDARLDDDKGRHAVALRKLADQDSELPLALYVAEGIARAPGTGRASLGAIAAWRRSWEAGMPTDRRQFYYLRVRLAVPGQPGVTDGKVFFHLTSRAEIAGAGLQLPPLRDDPSVHRRANKKLSADTARALFNVVQAVQRQNGLDIWRRIQEDIADDPVERHPESQPRNGELVTVSQGVQDPELTPDAREQSSSQEAPMPDGGPEYNSFDVARANLDKLTAREREVAVLVWRGKTNKEIGAELNISKRTADAHVSHILEKLRLRSRVEIAAVVNAVSPSPAAGAEE